MKALDLSAFFFMYDIPLDSNLKIIKSDVARLDQPQFLPETTHQK